MYKDKATRIECTHSNQTSFSSKKSWDDIYTNISKVHHNHQGPYFLETEGNTVMLRNDGNGIISATIQTSETASMLYLLFGGVWIRLSEEA